MDVTAPDLGSASRVPKYVQVRTALLRLLDEELGIDEAIPSERLLAERFQISRMTVRQAVEQLVDDGRLRKVAGKGTFVAKAKIVLPLELRSFSDDMRERGLVPGARVLGRRTVPAGDLVAEQLHIAPHELVHVLERLRTADGEPLAIERAHVLAEVAPTLLDEQLDDQSLYAVLENRFGVVLDAGEQTIEATLADRADGLLFGVPPGAPILLLVRRSFCRGRPVEYVRSHYRGDRYQLRTPLGGVSRPPLPD